MPFKSKVQERFLFSQHPDIAREFARATPDISALPEYAKKKYDRKPESNKKK